MIEQVKIADVACQKDEALSNSLAMQKRIVEQRIAVRAIGQPGDHPRQDACLTADPLRWSRQAMVRNPVQGFLHRLLSSGCVRMLRVEPNVLDNGRDVAPSPLPLATVAARLLGLVQAALAAGMLG